jgi:hypothetical protein
VLTPNVSSITALRQLHKFEPRNFFRQRELLSIGKSHEKEMLVLFQNWGGTLTEGRFHLVIQFEVLATIFGIGFVVLPGISVLPHLKRHLPKLSDQTTRPSFGRFPGS